ncbi:hypothetical protein [Streptomyces sp. NPDC059010]|uniref:hypothetical protein n=1 Tax=Streptomyces sp. NPDC059010 TaxID=3346695 RepID=UPI0036BF306D
MTEKELSSAVGHRIAYVAIPDDEALAGLTGLGLPDWLAEQIVAAFRSLRAGVNAYTADWVQRLTGREPRSIAEYARWIAPQLSDR